MSIEVGMQVKRRGRPPLNRIIDNGDGSAKLAQLPRYESNAIKDERIAHWAYRLELAANMKAGVMDSESRHQEVANTIKEIVLSIVSEMRQC